MPGVLGRMRLSVSAIHAVLWDATRDRERENLITVTLDRQIGQLGRNTCMNAIDPILCSRHLTRLYCLIVGRRCPRMWVDL